MAWVVPLLRACDGCSFKFSVEAPACPECGGPREGARRRGVLVRIFGGYARRASRPWVGRGPET